ncbi:MAG: UPF0236 family protein [Atopobiaceae bacterium]|jgi:hypothetical protein|nr:UPF0236 family protein [Atopobiaceae bacterium]MCH3944000.1 UPF0236 family protein [Atopobiaceae bacterium]
MDDVTATRIADLMEPAFLELLEGLGPNGDGDPLAIETKMMGMVLAAARSAYARALEALDDELCRSLPAGTRIRDRRRRTMGTRLGDVTFVRRTCIDSFGNTVVPVDDAIDLPERARVSPALEAEVVWLAAETSYRLASETLARSGASALSAATVEWCVHRAGRACRDEDERLAESLFVDGVRPDGKEEADLLCVESDGTMVNLQHEGDAKRCEIKAMVAYAGKVGGTGPKDRKVRRIRPVSFGCVGTARQMWAQGVAAVGSVYDITKVRTVHSGFDGAGWCEGDVTFLGFAEDVVGHLDPFHVNRAVARCFDADHAEQRSRALSEVYHGDARACADLLGSLAAEGSARPSVVAAVAPYLRAHASCIGVAGPSLGTMEPENQHVYQSRLSGVPCAWTRRGADSMARIRSRQASGRVVPRLSRATRITPKARSRREERIERALCHGPVASQVVSSEGRGWEYPTQASTTGYRADVQFESGLRADHKLVDPH